MKKIIIIFGVILAILAFYCIAFRNLKQEKDTTIFEKNIVTSDKEKIKVKVVKLGNTWRPMKKIEIADEHGHIFDYSIGSQGYNEYIPTDYSSMDINEDEALFWVLQADGKELIYYKNNDSHYSMSYADKDEYSTPNFKKAEQIIKSSEFLDHISSENCNKEKWSEYLDS